MALAVRYPVVAILQSRTVIALLRARKVTDLEKAIAYGFKDRALLTQALTHSSMRVSNAPRTDNERLEFLGDRVLGLAVAEMLNARLPSVSEGELARNFNRLVRGGTCAAIGRSIGLGAHLVLSSSEADNGGRDKETILADAMEAVLGAVFLEAGFDRARKIVTTLWGPMLDSRPRVAADPKSALQEWAQGRGFALPRYVEVARKGPDHAPKFVAEVRIEGCEPGLGEGPSKRHAEQAAASAVLKAQGVWSEIEP